VDITAEDVPEVLMITKVNTNMGLILNGYGVMGVFSNAVNALL